MTSANLTLVSHQLCPYVQRAVISLFEKGVPFERRYVDLGNKPEWFLAISPLGKVPLLIVNDSDGEDVVLFESAVICEYLDETIPSPGLHPNDPLERARHRGWIELGSAILADIWGFAMATDGVTFSTKRSAILEKFARIESAIDNAPYFAGIHFSLVDATYAPIFRYFDAFDTIASTHILEVFPKLSAWRQALAARESVRNAVNDEYGDLLRALLRERGAWLLRVTA